MHLFRTLAIKALNSARLALLIFVYHSLLYRFVNFKPKEYNILTFKTNLVVPT